MANVNTKAHVLTRDGFVCRYCGIPLYLPQAVKVLDCHVDGLDLWDRHGKREPLRTRWATVDHIIPEDDGGMDILKNLAACCVACNSRKGNTRTESVPSQQSRSTWNGLSSIFLALAPTYSSRLSSEDRKWLSALRREGVLPSLDDLEVQVADLQRLKCDDRSVRVAPDENTSKGTKP